MLKNDTTTKNSSKNFKALCPIIILFLFFILPLVACPLWGQVVQKKELTPSDYHLWGELNLDKIAPDQQWASYRMSYDNGIDTLFVRNTISNKIYSYPFGDNSIFTKNNTFVCLTKQGLQILNLKTGKQEIIKLVSQYAYSYLTDHLIINFHSERDKDELLIRTPLGKIVKEVQDVTHFSLSPNEQELVYSTFSNNKYALLLIDLKQVNSEKRLLMDGKDKYDGFTWQKDGKSLAFIAKSNDLSANSLFYYILGNDKLYELNPDTQPNFPNDAIITSDHTFNLMISDDLQRVFFNIKNKNLTPENKIDSGVEIWNANDKWVYTEELKHGQFQKAVKVALWFPLSHIVTSITTNELPKIILSGNQEYAFLSNPKDYEPQFDMEGPRDFYLLNLKTLEKSLFLKKQSAHYSHIIPSPKGKYIAYFKENDWWIYNISAKTHKNITAAIGSKFAAKEQLLAPESVCGNPGWNVDDKEILIYDQYDLWAITPDGGSFRRLTHGRESKIRYRIANIPNKWPLNFVYDGLKVDNFDLEKELFLRGEGEDGQTGYFKWKNHFGEEPIVYRDAYIDQLYYTSKKQKFFYREQKFDLSPQLMIKKNLVGAKSFFQSNPQQQKYYWGKSELIKYQNSKGQNLKGVLLYPANYDPQKKYPMIVHIYELQSKLLHQYTNPTSYNETGFNTTVFTTKGYFVLLPDIIHEYQNPGGSAVDCVTAATRKVIEKGVVNPAKIGLIGHSFGGYETAFIITQTQLFATAVASGGITDLTSFYLTVSQNSGKPDMWRFESEQWIMGKTPFEAPLAYRDNSPITHVEKIKTPLLLWTGKQDEQVDPHQSMEYYLALRRLGMKNIMLLYPNEGHVISNPTNQKDLMNRIEQWFAYYLKDDVSSAWVNDGVK
jgi:dipeptidyl aminopeptidase/acylaminoacyl peptidase